MRRCGQQGATPSRVGLVVATATDNGWMVTACVDPAEGRRVGSGEDARAAGAAAGHAAVQCVDRVSDSTSSASKRRKTITLCEHEPAEPASQHVGSEASSPAVDTAPACGSAAEPAAAAAAGSVDGRLANSGVSVAEVTMAVHPLRSPVLMRTSRLERFANDYGAVRRWYVAAACTCTACASFTTRMLSTA